MAHHLQRRLAFHAGRAFAVERVLADVEIEGRQFDHHEVEQRAGDTLELEGVVARAHKVIQLGQPVQHQPFQFGHVRERNGLALVVRQRAQHPADGVPELAIGVDIGLQDRLAEPLVFPVIGGDDPQAQDIGAGLLDDVLRHHRVAEGLRHLAPLLVHGEAMGDDGVVGRAAARAAAFQQRGMEPAAMLVGPFQIDVRRPFQVRAVLQREGVRRAGIETHIEDILDHDPGFVGSRPEEPLARAFGEPGVRALGLESLCDALVDRFVLQHGAVLVHEDADRHAPCPLTGKHPVRPLLDHGAQPRLACGGNETRVVDGGEGAVAQRILPP